MASNEESTQQPNQLAQPQRCRGCAWCEEHKGFSFHYYGSTYTSEEACYALHKVLNSAVSSPNGVIEREIWHDAVRKGLPEHILLSSAISCRRRHEENMQKQRHQLFLRQQQQGSSLGGALFSAFSIRLLKHIASYLDKPSQALFAVSVGNFDMSSISAMSTATNRNSGNKRNSDGSLRAENTTICLADIPVEPLAHVASFLSAPSQAIFGLAVAATEDKILNMNSFAIVGDQWDSLDFGAIEKELAERLTDDDIKAVLWCIDAGNKVKRLSLAHCVNITGSCLEPLWGSQIIEQIDLSLVGRHEVPVLIETWHPPRKDEYLVLPFVPPISCENVLPILDSIIVSEQCSLQHLQFPKAWRTNYPSEMKSDWTWWSRWDYDTTYKPDPTFVHFLMRYNQMLMNRGISCVKCSRNLPSSGYQLVGSSVSDVNSCYTFGNQNHTCSQCMKHYCYRCGIQDSNEDFSNRRDGIGAFHLERCNVCEREQCVECSGMYKCEECLSSKCYCMNCRESTECSLCSDRICSDCKISQCKSCKTGVCLMCSSNCVGCDSRVCEDCDEIQECSNENCLQNYCNDCASDPSSTCQKCKRIFCADNRCSAHCVTCNQMFCRDCVTFRMCDFDGCYGDHCVDCPNEPFVECARTCAECNKEPCGFCGDPNQRNFYSRCDVCYRASCRTSCSTWQTEKKKLMDDQQNESRKDPGKA
eukprot:scaffold10223_cov96-Skeletonema_dohrnii-CCMP3373.AAC.6